MEPPQIDLRHHCADARHPVLTHRYGCLGDHKDEQRDRNEDEDRQMTFAEIVRGICFPD